jgi:hypothetical protein
LRADRSRRIPDSIYWPYAGMRRASLAAAVIVINPRRKKASQFLLEGCSFQCGLTPRTVKNRYRCTDGAHLDQFGRRGVVMLLSIGAVRPGRYGQALARRRRATRAAISVATPLNPALACRFGSCDSWPLFLRGCSVQSRHTRGVGLHSSR